MPASATLPPPKTAFSRISSVLFVDRIEPCLDFWVNRLGFEPRLEIAGEGGLEFVILGKADVELMYRTRASLQQEAPGLFERPEHAPWVVIYLEVDDLDVLLPRLAGVEVVVPLRETLLGTREIFVREPSGRIVALTSRG